MTTKISYQQLQAILKNNRLKSTPQRLIILEALHNLKHPSAEKIFDYVTVRLPGLSLGTVYKTLDTLVQNSLASKVLSESGNFRYDYNTSSHNHIYCTNTDEIIDYEDNELKEFLVDYFKRKTKKNLLIKDIRLQINVEKIDPKLEIQIT